MVYVMGYQLRYMCHKYTVWLSCIPFDMRYLVWYMWWDTNWKIVYVSCIHGMIELCCVWYEIPNMVYVMGYQMGNWIGMNTQYDWVVFLIWDIQYGICYRIPIGKLNTCYEYTVWLRFSLSIWWILEDTKWDIVFVLRIQYDWAHRASSKATRLFRTK